MNKQARSQRNNLSTMIKKDKSEWTKVDVKKKTTKAISETIEKRILNENNDAIVEKNEAHESNARTSGRKMSS